ncbi:hypothetical protein ACHAWO_013188 [Cyclotella atomus]|uniref:CN hydrolase domain-containing protein n=1 Tax=Cyclotella atomus TaxID=382360 RepID=A0ABD3NBB0_9STRA
MARLLLLSAVTALFADSSYLPIAAIFHPALYLAFLYSCRRWRGRVFGWIVVSLCRAVLARDYMYTDGNPPAIAYVEGLVIISVLYGVLTIMMLVQCCVWIDSERCNGVSGLDTQYSTYPNESTPLRVGSSTMGSSSDGDVKEKYAEGEMDGGNQIGSTMNTNSSHRHCTFIHHPRISPLVFPTLFTCIYQIVFRYSPIGGTGNPAMGLAQVPGLRQIVSVTGEISLVYWIGWVASITAGLGVFYSPSNRGRTKNRIADEHVIVFVTLTLAMFIFGSMRERSGRGVYLDDISQWPATQANVAPLKVSCLTRTSTNEMIRRTNERIAAGDDLIVWSETASDDSVLPNMFEWSDENTNAVVAATFYEQVQDSNKVYNRVQMMQSGVIIATYAKNRPVPVIESNVMRGQTKPHSTDVTFMPQLSTCNGEHGNCTASGAPPRQRHVVKTTMAICFDFDFSYLFMQAHDADLAVGPSWYWASIGQNLWEHNIFRAIENGFTLIKCSENGISGAVDLYGKTIAALPTLSDDVYTFKVPVQKGVQTWFESGGWIFGWACVGLSPLIFLVAVAGRSSGQNK